MVSISSILIEIMMKKIILLGVVLLIVLLSIKVMNTKETFNYSIITFQIEKGWGYTIFNGEKIVIRQDIIPSIQERKHFKNKEDALSCGKIMLKKLQQHKIPSITVKELRLNNINL